MLGLHRFTAGHQHRRWPSLLVLCRGHWLLAVSVGFVPRALAVGGLCWFCAAGIGCWPPVLVPRRQHGRSSSPFAVRRSPLANRRSPLPLTAHCRGAVVLSRPQSTLPVVIGLPCA